MAALRPSRLAKDAVHLAISAVAVTIAAWVFTSILTPGSIEYAMGGSVDGGPAWRFLAVLAVVGACALPVVLAGARLIAVVERARARALLDVKVVEPLPVQPAKPGVLRWARHQLTDATAWRAVCYLLLLAPLAITATVYASIIPFSLLALIDSAWAEDPTWWRAIPVLLFPLVIAVLAQLNRVLVRRLLSPTAAERARMLEHNRDQAVDTAIGDLRRIERDLHDGVQARLVSLTMELGRVRKRLEDDPQAAQELLERAHGDAKLALAELRDLARGIYPAVLTDRGLDAALSALTARMPVPVTVDVTLPGRPPEAVETAGYFVIAELLTNVAKHSGASSATVTVRGETDRVVIAVADDGHGGANATDGSGLVGLSERVAALEGTLSIDSPTGGPTRVTVEIPCRQYRSVSS